MSPFRVLTSLALALVLSACGSSNDQRATPGDGASPTSSEMAAKLAQGTLGLVRYSYDPDALIRADIDLAVPPDFEQTVFAVKFVPVSLAENLGQPQCSFGPVHSGDACLATAEVGFAIALLERPTQYYIDNVRGSAFDDGSAPVTVNGYEGVTVLHRADRTTTRYTFLSLDGRTLLLVDRHAEGVDVGREALEQVRASLSF